MFITFEGGDGSGKSSVVNAVKHHVFRKYIDNSRFLFVNDPSNDSTELEKLRCILLSKNYDFCKDAELMLYMASRAELVNKFIKPALDAGVIVFSDRFYHSSWVYQGILKGHGIEKIKYLNQCAGNIHPDLTVLLDVDAKIGLSRSNDRLDDNNIDEGRWEAMGLAVHEKINQGYRDIMSWNPDKFFKVDTNKLTLEKVCDIVIAALEHLEVI